ncbi:phosphatidylinositol-3-phosphatase SAC1-B-like [Lytechinus pictus]|uniref:phosphatidylinositol-3-phosphatase SAC1-B-like n=1 Tax=Lytechinus pictus TaxID=7653 RepID=UPI00240DBB50|nr:phosphatidylinositol-3-phosphatase SAC1-B-like [Lytechinus pictus]
MSVHETLLIHTQDDKFFIEARDPGTKEVLVIDRLSQEIILEENGINIPPGASSKPICGIMGIIKLLRGSYLVIITKKEKVGEINGQAIWKISGTESIPYKKTDLHLTEEQKQDNKVYESMVQYALENNTYYFSTTFDLTHSLQRLYNTSPEFLQMPLFERADQRFVWNGHMLREFTAQPELGKFILPVMVGFISIRIGIINTKRFDYILISRRSCLRAGTRFYMRGLDEQGQAANFVETEQIVQFNGSRASFVQTRGSIPLFWSQRPNLKYKPVPQISESQSHLDAFKRHFDDQVVNYGNQVLINLIDHKGVEDRLEKMFAKTVYDSGNQMMRYESFDFHYECRKMRWDRLSILMDKLAKDQQQFGYFWMDANNELLKHQVGVFRTNCMDCLDRTNVVQSMLARRALQDQMQQMGILKQGESLDNHYNSAFESTFKNTWADNADACSKQYAGTGALKTDFTRTGKRTKLGLMKDGLNSMIRYYMNNFVDGFRQDSTDLLLGNYVVEENEGVSRPSPIRKSKDAKFMLLPAIAMVAFSMLLISMLIPSAELHLQIAYILFWLAATIICVGLMGVFGMEFVDQPKLSQAKVKSD